MIRRKEKRKGRIRKLRKEIKRKGEEGHITMKEECKEGRRKEEEKGEIRRTEERKEG